MSKKNKYGHYGWTLVQDIDQHDKVMLCTIETREEFRRVNNNIGFVLSNEADAIRWVDTLNDPHQVQSMGLKPLVEVFNDCRVYIGGQKIFLWKRL